MDMLVSTASEQTTARNKAENDAARHPVFPADMGICPLSRNPIRLSRETVQIVLSRRARRLQPTDDRPPVASIVVVTFNNLLFTRICLESLLAHTKTPCEVLVIDNASDDETVPYVRELARLNPRLRLLVNERNVGFAAASNRGLAAATGEYLVLLNNDTIVSRGWLEGLIEHLQDGTVGLIGATTNRIGNEAEIPTAYADVGGFEAFAAERAARCRQLRFDIRTATMFCVAMRRPAWERIGPIDEQFGLGMFEDDDYSMRCRGAGLRVVCAEDVFVHHFGQASFGHLAAAGTYGTLFHENRRKWESKWRCQWQPYERRNSREYSQNVREIRSIVQHVLPAGATVLVVSKGDQKLLDLPGCTAWHFPQAPDGTYAGFYPADGPQAVAQLQELQHRGAEYLILPATSAWWLAHYPEFRRYLLESSGQQLHLSDRCAIYRLPM